MRKLLALAAVLVVYSSIAAAAIAGTASSAQTQFVAGAPTTRVGVDIVIKVTTLPPEGDCPQAANLPDGDDPWGGCFPGPESTGVPDGTSLTAYTGLTTPAADTLIDGKLIDDCLNIVNPRIVIRNSRIEADCTWIIDAIITTDYDDDWPFTGGDPADWLLVEDSEIICVTESQGAIGERGFIARRVEISGGCANNIDGDQDYIIEDSYLWDLPVEDEIHHGDGIQTALMDAAVIRHNTVFGQDAFGGNTTSAIITPQSIATGTGLVEFNLFRGGAYMLYCPLDASFFQANNNVFGAIGGPWAPSFGYTQNCGQVGDEFIGNIDTNGNPVIPD